MTYLTALDCVRFATLLGTLMPGRVREVRELSRGVGWLERSCPGGVGRCGAAFCMQSDRTRVTFMATVYSTTRPLMFQRFGNGFAGSLLWLPRIHPMKQGKISRVSRLTVHSKRFPYQPHILCPKKKEIKLCHSQKPNGHMV